MIRYPCTSALEAMHAAVSKDASHTHVQQATKDLFQAQRLFALCSSTQN